MFLLFRLQQDFHYSITLILFSITVISLVNNLLFLTSYSPVFIVSYNIPKTSVVVTVTILTSIHIYSIQVLLRCKLCLLLQVYHGYVYLSHSGPYQHPFDFLPSWLNLRLWQLLSLCYSMRVWTDFRQGQGQDRYRTVVIISLQWMEST